MAHRMAHRVCFMPKQAREMAAQAVARLREVGDHHVGGVPGLLLRVKDGGHRQWCLRYQIAGKRRIMGLGTYPAVTLAQARESARAARAQLAQGLDPINARAQAQAAALAAQRNAMTFTQAAAAYIAARAPEWRNLKHRAQWENTLATYAAPVIGRLDVAAIEQTHVLRVLDPIWRTKTETAVRLRGRMEAILDWCTVQGRRSGPNPARWRGHLDQLLPNPARIAPVEHHAAVEWREAPAVYARIAQVEGISAQALRLLILTCVRTTELLAATWPEIDLAAATWTLPAIRMKIKTQGAHRVPLSEQALALLHELPRLQGSPYLFPGGGRSGGTLSNAAMLQTMRRLHIPAVPHGWRSTFRDWAAETTTFAPEVAEKALAHAIKNKVEAAYRRGDLLDKRRQLMQAWANYLAPPAN